MEEDDDERELEAASASSRQSGVPSSSSSSSFAAAAASSSLSLQIALNRNAILVSHRQVSLFYIRVTKHTSIPETSTQRNPEPSLVGEGKQEKNEEDASKHMKKEPKVTIESALSAAFARYSDKISKKNNLQREKVEESSSAVEAEADKTIGVYSEKATT